MENHLNRPEIQEARLKGKGSSIRYSTTIGVDMLYVAVPVKTGEAITGYVRLARPLYDVRSTIEKVYDSFFLAIIYRCRLFVNYSHYIFLPSGGADQGTGEIYGKIASWRYIRNILINTSDETKILADNINYLVEELNSQIRLANEESSKLVTAFASMTEGVMILDAADRIEVVNQAMSNILAMQYGDVTGKTLMEVFRNVDLQKAFLKFKETREPLSQEITLGSLQPVVLTVSISGVKSDNRTTKRP